MEVLAQLATRFSRRVSLVLAFVLFATQLHYCETQYYLPTGQRCSTCPTLALSKRSAEATVKVTDFDCQDCCQVTGCDHDVKPGPGSMRSNQIVPALIPCKTEVVFRFLLISAPVSIPRIEGAPTTGPPSRDQSRAPPASTLA